MQQQQQTQAARNPTSAESTAEAPPKQVALAMDRLAQAARLIADVRLGADRLLEALFVSAQPHQTTKPLHLFLKEDSSMRQHLQDLRTIGMYVYKSTADSVLFEFLGFSLTFLCLILAFGCLVPHLNLRIKMEWKKTGRDIKFPKILHSMRKCSLLLSGFLIVLSLLPNLHLGLGLGK